MKAMREHRVPLSRAALDVLRRIGERPNDPDALIFAGKKRDPVAMRAKPLAIMTLTMLMRGMTSVAFSPRCTTIQRPA